MLKAIDRIILRYLIFFLGNNYLIIKNIVPQKELLLL